MEGMGPGPIYMDINMLTDRIVLENKASLTKKNIWADDCFMDAWPFSCLTKTTTGSSLLMEDLIVSDARCVNTSASLGMKALLQAATFSNLFTTGYNHVYINSTTVYLNETNWVSYIPPPARWRMVNTLFTCTGNHTHPLPKIDLLNHSYHVPLSMWLVMVALLVFAVWSFIKLQRKKRSEGVPEFVIARNRGYALQSLIGAGHYGQVYKAKHIATDQMVAIKVLNLNPENSKELRQAVKEYYTMKSLQHPGCLRVISRYSNYLRQTKDGVEIGPLAWSIEDYVHAPNSLSIEDTARAISLTSSTSISHGDEMVSNTYLAPLFNGSIAEDASYTTVQLHIVLEFCDMGTLADSISNGRHFYDPDGFPVLSTILSAALDIAEGLAYLHHPDRQLVHRDLSADNVLLKTEPNKRGFRAVLSDFGLTTLLTGSASHRSSKMRGTVVFMSPEAIESCTITPALDIYSLGIILYMLWTRKSPYDFNKSSLQIAREKTQLGGEHWDMPWEPPQKYELLVRECCAYDKNRRLTAQQVISRIKELLGRK